MKVDLYRLGITGKAEAEGWILEGFCLGTHSVLCLGGLPAEGGCSRAMLDLGDTRTAVGVWACTRADLGNHLQNKPLLCAEEAML